MSPLEILSHLDVYGGWLAAVVGGLVALGWLLRRVVRVCRTVSARAREVGRKIDTLESLAGYELNSNGGGSIKDRVGRIPQLEANVDELKTRSASHDRNLRSIRSGQTRTGRRLDALEAQLAALTVPTTAVTVGPDATTVETKAGGITS